jgi:hypothetical protein
VTTEEKAAIQANLLRVARDQLALDAIFSAPFVAEILDAAIAEERAACAQIADAHVEEAIGPGGFDTGRMWRGQSARTIAAAIRARP